MFPKKWTFSTINFTESNFKSNYSHTATCYLSKNTQLSIAGSQKNSKFLSSLLIKVLQTFFFHFLIMWILNSATNLKANYLRNYPLNILSYERFNVFLTYFYLVLLYYFTKHHRILSSPLIFGRISSICITFDCFS